MSKTPSLAVSLVLLAALQAAAPAAQAGRLELKFVEPARFSDVGWYQGDKEQNLETLKAIFESLAGQLPATQTLRIEVTDVDLAGETNRIFSRPEVRVLRGRADWPRIELRYSLVDGERSLQQGQAQLADMAYLSTSLTGQPTQHLAYERRMIERWFNQTLLGK